MEEFTNIVKDHINKKKNIILTFNNEGVYFIDVSKCKQIDENLSKTYNYKLSDIYN